MRECSFAEAVREGTDLCLAADPAVYLMGLGAPDPGGIFGTTKGLRERYGPDRVMDMPVSENGMTGVAIGSALAGMRPILTHQRMDFMLLSMEQLVNQAAKWHYTCDGQMRVPLVIRVVVGRGWGQGPQHSQSLHSWFAPLVSQNNLNFNKGLQIIEHDRFVIFRKSAAKWPFLRNTEQNRSLEICSRDDAIFCQKHNI